MQQQLFSLTGGILDLNEHLNVNCLGQGYASHRRGRCFSGVRAPGPWLENMCCLLLPWGRDCSELDWDRHQGRQRSTAVCVRVSVRVCRVFSTCVGQGRNWTWEVSGICDRMGLHIHCSPRMVLEARLLLSLRISGAFVLTGYLPIGIRKHLLEFIFKWFQSFKDLRDPKDL